MSAQEHKVEIVQKFGAGALAKITQAGFTPNEDFNCTIGYSYDPGPGLGHSSYLTPGHGTVDQDGNVVAYAWFPVSGGELTFTAVHDSAAFKQVVQF